MIDTKDSEFIDSCFHLNKFNDHAEITEMPVYSGFLLIR